VKKTILVTGGAGYIGSCVAHLLHTKGYEVIILDKLIYAQKFEHSWAKLIQADFADKDILKKIFTENKIEAVLHFAAFIEVGRSVKDPADFYNNNVVKTLALLEEMQKHKVKNFIFSSSCAVYGTPQKLPLREDHPKKPISPYGNTKLAVEMILEDFANAYGMSFVGLRYFNAAGAIPEEGLGEQHEPETHIIPLLLKAAMQNKEFKIFGTDYSTPDGTCIRDYLHVKDLATAHCKALEYLLNGATSNCFNLGTGTGYSVRELINIVEQVVGTVVKIQECERREGDPAVLVSDASTVHDVLGWKSEFSDLGNIIRDAYEFEVIKS